MGSIYSRAKVYLSQRPRAAFNLAHLTFLMPLLGWLGPVRSQPSTVINSLNSACPEQNLQPGWTLSSFALSLPDFFGAHVTSHPWERMISPNQNPYELPTPKHWRIIHHIYGLKYELLHELLYYIRVHRSRSARSCNSESVTKDSTLCYKGPHQALRCGVIDRSLELGLSADLPVLRWVATGPHELITSPTVLRHFCNQKDP
jgi:hypothetical protein